MRKRTIAAIAAVTVIGGCAAVTSGGSSEEPDESVSVPSQSQQQEEQPESAASQGDVVGNWEILNKPKIGQEFGMFATAKLKVRNVSDSEDEPWLELRLTRGDTLVTTYDCVGQTVRPGEQTTLECSSLDDYAKWTDMEIRNAF